MKNNYKINCKNSLILSQNFNYLIIYIMILTIYKNKNIFFILCPIIFMHYTIKLFIQKNR